jgi:phenylalanyl-tRNA synthetase beta chain
MKISREWLLEFVDFSDIPFEEVTDLITTRVAEIEEVYTVGAPCDHAIVVKVEEVSSHPTKDNLTVVKVSDGKSSYQVVCSAPNVRKGMLTTYVPVGGVVRKASLLAEEEELRTIVKGEVQGVMSEGTLVSESELGVSSLHKGIVDILEDSIEVGTSVASLGFISDKIIDIDNKSLTHRPDLWCHFGFARELSAILKRPLKVDYDSILEVNEIIKAPNLSQYKIEIENPEDCRRLSFTSITGISKHDTPRWMKRRLFSIGAGVRNLLVDLSNYILHEVGQPNHAFDISAIRGNTITCRRAKINETFVGLDEVSRELTGDDIVMADSEGILDMAGIIGGLNFSISAETNSVLLAGANFDPVVVRKTCKFHSIRTDSSVRFEKSLSPVQTILAPVRFVDLLRRVGATFNIDGYIEAYKKPPSDLIIPYQALYIQERLGGVPEVSEIDEILKRLKFEISGESIKVPYFRATRDISISADLVEEVGRTIGYERVPSVPPQINSARSKRSVIGSAELKIREVLAADGFTEVYCYTFASKERTEKLGYKLEKAIEVQNSVDKNLNIVQLSLVPNMLDVINLNNKNTDSFFAFEIGRAYEQDGSSVSGYVEKRLCSISGVENKKAEALPQGTPSISEGSLFYGIRKSAERLIYALCHKEATFHSYNESNSDLSFGLKSWMHPFRSARIIIDSTVVGMISEVRPSCLDIKSSRAVVAELDIMAIVALDNKNLKFKAFSRFPKSHFEVSLVVDSRLEYSELENKFKNALKSDNSQIEIVPFSIYRGAPLKEAEKSVSLRFTFSLDDGTLSGEQIEQLQGQVLKIAEDNNYHLRG